MRHEIDQIRTGIDEVRAQSKHSEEVWLRISDAVCRIDVLERTMQDINVESDECFEQVVGQSEASEPSNNHGLDEWWDMVHRLWRLEIPSRVADLHKQSLEESFTKTLDRLDSKAKVLREQIAGLHRDSTAVLASVAGPREPSSMCEDSPL